MVPLSIRRKLDKAEKDAVAAIRAFKSSSDEGEFMGEISSITTELNLVLDRVFHEIWRLYKDENVGSKPNLYFPVCASEKKFLQAMKKYQLSSLSEKNPVLYGVILNCQPFSATNRLGYLRDLTQVASVRHERDPEIVDDNIVTEIGVGEHSGYVTFKNLQIGPKGIIVGDAVDAATGLPIEIITSHTKIRSLEDTKLPPEFFLQSAVMEAKKIIMECFRAL